MDVISAGVDGDSFKKVGVAIDEHQRKIIGPALKLKELAQSKMEKARETLDAYIETKSQIKKNDPTAYKEGKKLLREGLDLK